MMELPWLRTMEPFNLFGNTWFVGSRPASTHIIDTGDGLILLDSGYQERLYLVINSIWKCGFSPYDIKYIIHSHGHIDHAAATKALVELTGAKTFIGADDCGMVNGSDPKLTWACEFNTMQPAAFEPDVLLKDGDKITLGNVEIDCVHTPGHTRGTISFFWNMEVDGKIYRAGTMGGAGLNTLKSEYIHRLQLESEDWRGAFRNSLARCRQEKVDVFVGNHAGQNQTPERYQRLCEGDKFAFVDPQAWGNFLDKTEAALNTLEIEDPL
ncbi:MAG: MBL fold metallo-hydrolase [Lentisphaeria bacterium]|nr:MBL fold metallo-hydrolase [Lentisphaeria bacterium]